MTQVFVPEAPVCHCHRAMKYHIGRPFLIIGITTHLADVMQDNACGHHRKCCFNVAVISLHQNSKASFQSAKHILDHHSGSTQAIVEMLLFGSRTCSFPERFQQPVQQGVGSISDDDRGSFNTINVGQNELIYWVLSCCFVNNGVTFT